MFCLHSLRCNKPALIYHYESTGSAPRVNHASSKSPETSGGAPARPLGLLLASSLPNYSTHLLSPTSRRRFNESRVRRLRITEKQQLGLPAAHPHPKGLKCSDVVLMFEGGGSTMFTCWHHFADKHCCSNHSLYLKPNWPEGGQIHNTV